VRSSLEIAFSPSQRASAAIMPPSEPSQKRLRPARIELYDHQMQGFLTRDLGNRMNRDDLLGMPAKLRRGAASNSIGWQNTRLRFSQFGSASTAPISFNASPAPISQQQTSLCSHRHEFHRLGRDPCGRARSGSAHYYFGSKVR
jgi:hypothetical protein